MKPIQIIHSAFCASILLFTAVTLFINTNKLQFIFPVSKSDPLQIIAPLFALLGIYISRFLFAKIIGKIDPLSSPQQKFVQYQSAFIIRCAFLEGPAFFNIVVFLLTGNIFLLLFSTACLIALWIARPTRDNVYDALKLQHTDIVDGI